MREFKDLKIAVAGTGYVGLSIATLLSQHHHVTAVDIVPEKVELINNRKSPIQDEYIEKYLAEKELDLTATLDAKEAYSDADFVVIAAPTNYDWSIYQKQIQLFAKDHGLKIIAVGRYCKWAYRSYTAASFEQWICSFRKATYVLTDSFHGTVFSIKNNKQMILCSRPDKRAKIESLLNDARIQRKFYDGKESIETYLQAVTIDYQEVNQSMKKLVDFSMAYLQKSLADNVDYYGEH